MKKLPGFVFIWMAIFGILALLDSSGIFDSQSIESFFSEEFTLPEEYPPKKQNTIAEKESNDYTPLDEDDQEDIQLDEIPEESEKDNQQKKSSTNNHSKKQKNSTTTTYQQAQYLYKKGAFQKSIEKLNGLRGTPQWNSRAQNLMSKCRSCASLTEGISRKKAFNKNVTRIKMTNGKEYIGRIVDNKLMTIRFKMSWGTIEIPKKRIAIKEKLDIKKHRKNLYRDLKKRAQKMDIANKTSILKIITESVQNRMDRIVPLLVRNLEDQDPSAINQILEYKANRIYKCYIWCETMRETEKAEQFFQQLLQKFPNSNAANEAREYQKQALALAAPKRTENTTKTENNPKQQRGKKPYIPAASGPGAKFLKAANKYYNIAYAHLKKSFPGSPNADDELEKAKKGFKEAAALYEKALAVAPNDTRIQSQLQETMEFYHHCIKQSRVK